MTFVEFLTNIVPSTSSTRREGRHAADRLRAILVGVALSAVHEAVGPVLVLFESLSKLFFASSGWSWSVAPIGAFGRWPTRWATSASPHSCAGEADGVSLPDDGGVRVHRAQRHRPVVPLQPPPPARYIKEEISSSSGTSSSEAALPAPDGQLEHLGCARPVWTRRPRGIRSI